MRSQVSAFAFHSSLEPPGDKMLKIKSGRHAGDALDQSQTTVGRTLKANNGDIFMWEQGMGEGPFSFGKDDIIYVERGLREEERHG